MIFQHFFSFFEKKVIEILLIKERTTNEIKAKLKKDPTGKQHPRPRVSLLPKDLQIKLLF